MPAAPTWIVLARDVSDSVVVGGQRRTAVAAVLDAETGLVVNVSPGTSIEGVLGRALKSALVTPARPLEKAVPQRLVVPPELLQATQSAASRLSWLADTAVTEGSGMDGAEEVMDSLIGHLEGRAQPDDLPTADDFRVLYRELQAYVEAAPWTRWTDSDWFTANLELGGDQVELACLVLGNAGVQHGFNAVPDAESTPGRQRRPTRRQPRPSRRRTHGAPRSMARNFGAILRQGEAVRLAEHRQTRSQPDERARRPAFRPEPIRRANARARAPRRAESRRPPSGHRRQAHGNRRTDLPRRHQRPV